MNGFPTRRSEEKRADFVFARAPGGETYLGRQYVTYPFHICRPHRFDGDPPGMATLYVQSCAGGIFEGDRLVETIRLEAGARAHVTSQASTIVHGMEGGEAIVSVAAEVGPEAMLELLPDPAILFPGARLTNRLHLRLHRSASAIVSDSFLMHDPSAAGRLFDRFHGELHVADTDGSLLFLDRCQVTGTRIASHLPGIMGPYHGHGWIAAISRDGQVLALIDALRGAVDGMPGIYAGASSLPNGAGAWLRILAEDGAALKNGLQAGWRALRQSLTGAHARPRRK